MTGKQSINISGVIGQAGGGAVAFAEMTFARGKTSAD